MSDPKVEKHHWQDSVLSLLELVKTETAVEIEAVADAIDMICDAAEKENEEIILEISNTATLATLLQMLLSPVQEFTKLSLAGLERLLTIEDLAIAAIELGLYETVKKLFLEPMESLAIKLKASAVLVLLLISDYDKGLKQLSLQNGVFDAHMALAHSQGNDTEESILRFLFAISEDCKEGQEKLVSTPAAIAFILELIKRHQYQALGTLCNLISLEGIKAKIVVSEIETLLKPLLSDDADIDDLGFDKVVLILANLLDSEKEDLATHEILVEQLQDMALAVLDGSLVTTGLVPILSGINNLSVGEHNKVLIGNADIPKLLMDILQREGPFVFPLEEAEAVSEEEDNGDSIEIKSIAALAVWNLMFHELNRKKFETNGSIEILQKLSAREENRQIKRNLEGCLWTFKQFSKTSSNNPVPAVNVPEEYPSGDTNNSTSTSSSARKGNKSEIEGWSVEDVRQWLTRVGLGQYPLSS